jgi:hypothetical protein
VSHRWTAGTRLRKIEIRLKQSALVVGHPRHQARASGSARAGLPQELWSGETKTALEAAVPAPRLLALLENLYAGVLSLTVKMQPIR